MTTGIDPNPLSLLEMLDVFTDLLEISPGKNWVLNPLTMTDIAILLHKNAPAFFSLYSIATKMLENPKATNLDIGPILTAFPEIAAEIIALSTAQETTPATLKTIQTKMPITLQVIALEKIFKISVPDPKKLLDLLSVVMGQWQKGLQKARETNALLPNDGPTTSVQPSNSLPTTDTA